MNARIKVMLVDDSAVVRQVFAAMLGDEPVIEWLGAFPDPIFAQKAMAQAWPDVLILDVEMPRMDGITFLQQLMATKPLPVIICSTLTTAGAATTVAALQAGAFEIIEKPNTAVRDQLSKHKQRFLSSIKSAARANMRAIRSLDVSARSSTNLERKEAQPVRLNAQSLSETTERLVAIGTSTGGTQALELLLRALPLNSPGIVIVQHMPAAYTQAFADRLNSVCDIRVKQASEGDRILAGHAYIAPGGQHLEVIRQGAYYYTSVKDGPPVSRHRPSVNVLFSSVATSVGRNATGIIMTGMGDDGARGLLEMKKQGAKTFAQDEASCVVFGMPREAIKLHAVDATVALADLHLAVLGVASKSASVARV